MNDIGKIPLLSKQDEIDVAAEIAQGSEEAFEKLVNSNLRLVVKIAHDFKRIGQLEDIVSAGNKGLIRAAEKFDPAKGAKFSSYSAWWIKQSIRRTITEEKLIVIPVASLVKIKKIKNAAKELEFIMGYCPSDEELALHVKMTKSVVRRYRDESCDKYPVSLHEPLMNGEDGVLGDMIPNENDIMPVDVIINKEYHKYLTKALNNLNKREQLIIMHRYGLKGRVPKTLEEVSKLVGRTRERVRQLQDQALYKMKKELELEL